MTRHDIAIIGTGPAGLSAALTAKARNKDILLLGSDTLSSKVQKAHRIANYLGLPNVSGEEMQRTFLKQVKDAGIAITPEKVTLVYPMGDHFAIQAGGADYEATSVIIATGVVPSKTIPGEEEFLGRGVSYCATCDAALYKGKTAIVVGYDPSEEHEAAFLTEYASKVTYLPMYRDEPTFEASVEVVRARPQEITGTLKADALVTSEGTLKADGIFVLRESVAPARLVAGLEMDGSHVRVDRSLATNVAGCFAAGDVTGTPYQYMKSAGEGNVAALSAVAYVDALARS